jgi:hypothetical protein
VEKYHHNITSQFIVDGMYGMIIDNLAYEPRCIIRHQQKVQICHLIQESMGRKQKVLEMRFDTYEASYDNPPRLICINGPRNERSYYDIKTISSESSSAAIL